MITYTALRRGDLKCESQFCETAWQHSSWKSCRCVSQFLTCLYRGCIIFNLTRVVLVEGCPRLQKPCLTNFLPDCLTETEIASGYCFTTIFLTLRCSRSWVCWKHYLDFEKRHFETLALHWTGGNATLVEILYSYLLLPFFLSLLHSMVLVISKRLNSNFRGDANGWWNILVSPAASLKIDRLICRNRK